MRLDSGLFAKLRSKKRRRDQDDAEEILCCEWPGCALPASYKAPMGWKSCDAGDNMCYQYFCLEHVRNYNRDYNYFEGMSEDEVDAFHRASITGLRPTWSMGAGQSLNPSEWLRRRVHDLLQRWRLDDVAPAPAGNTKTNGHALLPEDREALDTLGFRDCDEIPAVEEIKARYKSLIKRFHPDARDSETSGKDEQADHFIRIMRAHDHLKAKASS